MNGTYQARDLTEMGFRTIRLETTKILDEGSVGSVMVGWLNGDSSNG